MRNTEELFMGKKTMICLPTVTIINRQVYPFPIVVQARILHPNQPKKGERN